MTGRRPPRGPADNPWRGGRPGGRGDSRSPDGPPHQDGRTDPRPGAVHVAELEELAVQPTGRSSRSRPGAAGLAALVAVALLLAGGFGILGGRPEPMPSGGPRPSAGAVAPTGTRATLDPPPPTPGVTPYAECGPEPRVAPVISLQTNGVPTPGLVEVIDPDAEPTTAPAGTTPADPLQRLRGPRVEVRPDVITELWIEGAACALRWSTGLYDPLADEISQIEQVGIDEDMDRRLAAQNRFDLSHAFAPLRALGHDIQLIGTFEFEGLAVVAWWRVAVQPLDLPVAVLRDVGTGEEIDVVAACHQRLRLANGYEEDVRTCEGDLSEALGPPAGVVAGATLSLDLDGLPVDDVALVCGRLSGRDFVAEPAPGCREDVPDGGAIPVPHAPGTWALALSTCANLGAGIGRVINTLCGTWYASVWIAETTSG